VCCKKGISDKNSIVRDIIGNIATLLTIVSVLMILKKWFFYRMTILCAEIISEMPLSITQWGLKHDDHAKHIASHVLNPFSNKLNFSLLVMNRGLFLHLRIDFYFAFQSHWKESEMKQSSWREKLLPRSNVSWDRETNNEVKKNSLLFLILAPI
jgi:hypothetical protein